MPLTTESTFSQERVAKDGLFPTYERLPVGANAKIFGGAIVGFLDGYIVSLAAFPQANPYGIAEGHPNDQTIPVGGKSATVDNTGGAAGALDVIVKRGVFLMKNSAGVEALAEADTGETCYFVDDETVSKSAAKGQRPACGTFLGFDTKTSGCWVQIGVHNPERIISTGLAGVDLSTHQFGAVRLTGGVFVKPTAGQRVFGILQNAPANGAVARVVVFGPTLAKAPAAGFTQDSLLASDANGLIVNAVATNQACGQARETAGANETKLIFFVQSGTV